MLMNDLAFCLNSVRSGGTCSFLLFVCFMVVVPSSSASFYESIILRTYEVMSDE